MRRVRKQKIAQCSATNMKPKRTATAERDTSEMFLLRLLLLRRTIGGNGSIICLNPHPLQQNSLSSKIHVRTISYPSDNSEPFQFLIASFILRKDHSNSSAQRQEESSEDTDDDESSDEGDDDKKKKRKKRKRRKRRIRKRARRAKRQKDRRERITRRRKRRGERKLKSRRKLGLQGKLQKRRKGKNGKKKGKRKRNSRKKWRMPRRCYVVGVLNSIHEFHLCESGVGQPHFQDSWYLRKGKESCCQTAPWHYQVWENYQS